MHVTHEGDTVTLESEQRSSEVQFHSAPLPNGASEPAAVLYAAYRRCSDFDSGNNAGQDYIAVKADHQTVVGVVADGVGQSFYGDLAGRRVAKYLVELLWTQRHRPPSDAELATALVAEAKAFQSEVDAFAVPAHLTPLLQEALAQTRVKGSQAVFAAFIVDLARGTTVIYQVGDVDAYLVHKDGSPERLQAPKRGRWSSGGQTDLLLRSNRFEGIKRILVQSDGATDAWASSVRYEEDVRGQFEELTRTRASVDDISVVAVTRSGKASSPPVVPGMPKDEPTSPVPPESKSEPPAPETVVAAAAPSQWRLLAAFAAGALTALVFVCIFQQSRPAVRPQAPAAAPRIPPPAASAVALRLTTSEYAQLKKKVGTYPVQPTAPGEVSIWAAVPRRLAAATFRLRSSGQTVTVPPISQDDAQRLFRIVLAQLPAGQPLPAVAELLDAKGGLLARGELRVIPRDAKPTTRGYYLLEPVPLP
ncbi:MAG TPA: protein phosphatase 2C domain-containing protein [Thermoanaerobaculia bacterium]|nr:protein phosphatase 2C domain-containing protein [Thermoanaerobaculia bacterium]